jgi:uncharacterized membrane protein HdeD (DUF308 family)
VPCAAGSAWSRAGRAQSHHRYDHKEVVVIFLGVVLLVLGWILGMSILYTVGAILLVIGLILLLIGFAGHPIGGRRHWF